MCRWFEWIHFLDDFGEFVWLARVFILFDGNNGRLEGLVFWLKRAAQSNQQQFVANIVIMTIEPPNLVPNKVRLVIKTPSRQHGHGFGQTWCSRPKEQNSI